MRFFQWRIRVRIQIIVLSTRSVWVRTEKQLVSVFRDSRETEVSALTSTSARRPEVARTTVTSTLFAWIKLAGDVRLQMLQNLLMYFYTCPHLPSYVCICEPGYVGDGHTCTDENECDVTVSSEGEGRCGGTADCINTMGGFDCVCKKGFTEADSFCKRQ